MSSKEAFVDSTPHLTGHGEDGTEVHIKELGDDPLSICKRIISFANQIVRDNSKYLKLLKAAANIIKTYGIDLKETIDLLPILEDAEIVSKESAESLEPYVISFVTHKNISSPGHTLNPKDAKGMAAFHLYRILTDNENRKSLLDVGSFLQKMQRDFELLKDINTPSFSRDALRSPDVHDHFKELEKLAGIFLDHYERSLQIPAGHISSLVPKLDKIAEQLQGLKLAHLAEQIDIVSNTLESVKR